jgi:peptide/nickel transport system permease protein
MFLVLRINKKGITGLLILVFLILIAVLASVLSPYDPRQTGGVEDILRPPCRKHWLGTEEVGRDLFSLILYGARISLLVEGFPVLFCRSSLGPS